MSLTPPPQGQMYLFDYLTPPLLPDSYRMHISTDVSFEKETHNLGDDRYFDVVGPRFTMAPTEVAGVFPPRNGHGPFADVLPQLAIKRRTLPWERHLDDAKPIGDPSDGKGLKSPYPTPWMALLLFEEGEYTLLQGVPLENVVPSSVFKNLGSPQNILCDAVEADLDLVKAIMPSKEELQLLTHVRWVNIEDRELSVEGSDGWFAVVMSNRLPAAGQKCRACLVSLEERSDLVKADPPPTAVSFDFVLDLELENREGGLRLMPPPLVIERQAPSGQGRFVGLLPAKARLVLLHSWQFMCEGDGTFFNLMQKLDVGMIGKVMKAGQPDVADTGHLKIELDDRAGTREGALYRGPLVPFQLTRDPLGPYHSADQARRATPETGVEDVSYAAAFEVGRLLAAADARLAQELMRWRRESYRQAARAHTFSAVEKVIQLDAPLLVSEPAAPYIAVAATGAMVKGSGPLADAYGIRSASRTIGFDAQTLTLAWGLSGPAEAQLIMGGDPGTLGMTVKAPAPSAHPDATIDTVAQDQGSVQRLQNSRNQILQNTKLRLGG